MQNTEFQSQTIEITLTVVSMVAVPKALGTHEIADKLIRLMTGEHLKLVQECDYWYYFSAQALELNNPLGKKVRYDACFNPLLTDYSTGSRNLPCLRKGTLRAYIKVDELEYTANMLVHQLTSGVNYWVPAFCLPETTKKIHAAAVSSCGSNS